LERHLFTRSNGKRGWGGRVREMWLNKEKTQDQGGKIGGERLLRKKKG